MKIHWQKNLNVKAMIILALAFFICCGSVHLLHGYQVVRSAKGLFRRAERAEAENDFAKEAEYLTRYLGYVHGDTAALEKYGSLLASGHLGAATEMRERAVAVFDKLLLQDPSRNDVRHRLVALKMGLDRYGECRDDLKQLMLASPDDGSLEFKLGRCEEAAAQFGEAATWYERSRRHAKTFVETYVRLADVLRRRLNKSARADEVMDARKDKDGVVASNSQAFQAYLARREYRKTYLLPGANDDAARALELAPDEADALLATAEVEQAAGRMQAATSHLEHGLARHPADRRFYSRLALLDLNAGRAKKGLDTLKRGVAELPNDKDLRFNLAEILVQVGETKEATPIISLLRQEGYETELLDFLDASILAKHERWSKAAIGLERVRPVLASKGLLALEKRACLELGTCYERLENPDRRYNVFREAVAIHLPEDTLRVAAHLGLASSLATIGKIEEAISEYRGILRLPEAPPGVELTLARLLILQNLRLPAKQRQWREVEQILDRSPQDRTASNEVAILRAERLMADSQVDRARELIEKARDQNPDQVDLWVFLASVIERQGEPEAALPVLAAARKRLGDRVELCVATARYWGNRGGPAALEALEPLARDAEKFQGDERYLLLSSLADAYQRAGQEKASKSLRARIAGEQPNDLRIRLVQCDAALAADDEETLRSLLAEVRRIEGEEGAVWRYGEALLQIRQARAGNDNRALLEARALLAAAEARRPSWSRLALAQAQIDDLRKTPDEALKNYLKAINLGERSPSAIRRAIQLLYERRRYAQADEILRKLQEQTPISGDLQKLAADISLQTQDDDRAMSLARQAVSSSSQDYLDQVWLGHVLWSISVRARGAGRREEAETRAREAGEAFRLALKLGGEAPEPWIALVDYLIGSDQAKAAEAAVEEAERVLAGGKAPLALAECCERIGRKEKALTYYQGALKSRPDDTATLQAVAGFFLRDGQLREAEPLLRRLIEQKSKSPEAAARARRVLSIFLAAKGGRRGSTEALTLLGLSGETLAEAAKSESSLEDLRAQAKVLALQTGRSRRREAIHLLEEIVRRENPPRSEDLFLLAQLLEADGDWPKARERLLGLLASDPKNPMFLARYVQSSVVHGQINEARTALEKLEHAQPNAPQSIELRSRILHVERKDGEAVALLDKLVLDRPSLTGPVAALLEELNQLGRAEELYRARASVPEAGAEQLDRDLALAGFLARHKRIREALDVYEGVWTKSPTPVVANACLSALYNAPTDDDAQLSRFARLLGDALAKQPENVPFLFCLANLRILERRYGEAELILRQVAGRIADSGSPLNNHAWLLAMRGERGAEALDLANRAIAIDGPLPNHLDTRAVAHLALGQNDAAVKDLEEALASTSDALMFLHLAEAHRKTNNLPAAEEAMKKALASGLDFQRIHPLEREAYRRLTGLEIPAGNPPPIAKPRRPRDS